jgi:hypothetical protein
MRCTLSVHGCRSEDGRGRVNRIEKGLNRISSGTAEAYLGATNAIAAVGKRITEARASARNAYPISAGVKQVLRDAPK